MNDIATQITKTMTRQTRLPSGASHHLFNVPVVVVSSSISLKSRHHGSHARTRVKCLIFCDLMAYSGFPVLISV